MYSCFQYLVGADLGLHYLLCLKVPFCVMLANYYLGDNRIVSEGLPTYIGGLYVANLVWPATR